MTNQTTSAITSQSNPFRVADVKSSGGEDFDCELSIQIGNNVSERFPAYTTVFKSIASGDAQLNIVGFDWELSIQIGTNVSERLPTCAIVFECFPAGETSFKRLDLTGSCLFKSDPIGRSQT